MAGFVGTSNLLTGDAAEAIVGRRRHVHGPAREDPPRRPGRRASAATRWTRRGRIREVVYLGPDTRYYRRRSTPAPSWSSPSRTSRRPRPRRSRSRAGRPAASGSDSTASPSRTGGDPWRRSTAHDASEDPGAGRAWRAGGRRVRRGVGGSPGARACRQSDRRRRGRAQPRHLGRLRRARRDRPGLRLGHPVREGDRLQGQHDRHDRLEQRRLAHAVRRLRRHLRSPATRPPASSRAASSRRSTRPDPPNYANVFEGLKNLPHNTIDGVNYGVPHGRGPNLLAYNTDVVTTAPTSWDPVWEGGADYKGKISVYDSSIYIADAALHLMTTQPDLGIKNPYQLNEAQFDAAIKLLEQQRDNGALYWGTLQRPDRLVRRRRRRRRDDLAVPGEPAPGREPARSRPSCPTRARPAGPTPG